VRRRLPLRKLPHAATGSAAAVAARRGSAVAGGLGATDHRAHKPAGGLAVAANGCVGAASGLRAGPPCSEPRVAMPEKGDRGADAIRAGVDVELLLLVEPPLRCLPLVHARPGARAASRRQPVSLPRPSHWRARASHDAPARGPAVEPCHRHHGRSPSSPCGRRHSTSLTGAWALCVEVGHERRWGSARPLGRPRLSRSRAQVGCSCVSWTKFGSNQIWNTEDSE